MAELSQLKVGASLKLYIHEHLREDAHDLYGFSEPATLTLFGQLISVSGVGPKMAMAILSATHPDQLKAAIASGRAELLQAVAGVGKRTADRIALELKNKVTLARGVAAQALAEDAAYEALRQLGYSTSQAKQALQAVPTSATTDEARVKSALKALARS